MNCLDLSTRDSLVDMTGEAFRAGHLAKGLQCYLTEQMLQNFPLKATDSLARSESSLRELTHPGITCL